MEFNSRGRTAPAPVEHTSPPHHGGRKRGGWFAKLLRIELFTVIVGSALLLAAVALFLGLGGGVGNESKKVNVAQYQAVFLNNGQVYFGKIKSLNAKYVDLTNVFYIEGSGNTASQTANQTQPTSLTLRKLGTTELHAPEDEMIINREQVTFWENLKDSSQVVTKIKEYYQNPNTGSGSLNQQTPSQTNNPQQ